MPKSREVVEAAGIEPADAQESRANCGDSEDLLTDY